MKLSRREAVKYVSAISGLGMLPGRLSGNGGGKLPVPAAGPLSASVVVNGAGAQQGQTYKGLGYKLFILDFCFSDVDPTP